MTESCPTPSAELGPKRLPARPPAGRISIALCTYNGAHFLAEQLDSYLAQTRPPDEVVVCDDGSSDATCAILDDFARRAPFDVQIVHNPTRLGSTKNFEKAIGICAGDFIATSNQDDVWMPAKLEACAAILEANPTCGLVFTDAEVVDDGLRPRGHTVWQAIAFGRTRQERMRRGQSFETLLRTWIVSGTTMMFRAAYRTQIMPIPEYWVHDGWIALMVSAVAPVELLAEKTVRYRQHGAQQIGGRKLSLGELYQKARTLGPPYFSLALRRFEAAQSRLHALAGELRSPSFLAMIDRKVEHQRRRLAIAECRSRGKRALWAMDELLRGGYSRYSPGLTHFVKDVVL